MAKSNAEAPDALAENAKRKKAAEEKRRRRYEELMARRKELLSHAEVLAASAQQVYDATHQRAVARAALTSHIEGFYDEIDKLAKGKALFAATDLAVQQINDIVNDAKNVIDSDPYLDRVKIFVPARDNPAYPDILLVTRTIQQCLARTAKAVEDGEKEAAKALREATTVVAGLKSWIETGRQPKKIEVEVAVGGKVTGSWFYGADDGNSYFDIRRVAEIERRTSGRAS